MGKEQHKIEKRKQDPSPPCNHVCFIRKKVGLEPLNGSKSLRRRNQSNRVGKGLGKCGSGGPSQGRLGLERLDLKSSKRGEIERS